MKITITYQEQPGGVDIIEDNNYISDTDFSSLQVGFLWEGHVNKVSRTGLISKVDYANSHYTVKLDGQKKTQND